MNSIGRVDRVCPRLEPVAVVVANLVPLVGVVGLGWDVTALVALYWFELAVLCFWAVVRAVFAGRPSEFEGDPLIVGALASKSVGVPIPRTDLRIRLSTLPVVVVAAPVLTLVWFLAGVMTVGIVGGDLADDALTTVAMAIIVIFVTEGVRTVVEYFSNGEYRDHSAQTAITGALTRGVVIFFAGMFTGLVGMAADGTVTTDDPITAADPTTVGIPVLVGLVLVKFGFDLAGVYRDRLVAFDESTSVTIGWGYEPPTRDRIDDPLPDARHCLRPTVRGRLIGGLSHTRRHGGVTVWILTFLLGLAAVPFAFGGLWTTALGLVMAAIVVPLGFVQIDYWLRYGSVEYRIGDDAIVAYDRLFRTPLWRIETWDESGLRVERDRVDALLGTSTMVIERPDRDRNLPQLPAVDPVLDVFDRRADRPDGT